MEVTRIAALPPKQELSYFVNSFTKIYEVF